MLAGRLGRASSLLLVGVLVAASGLDAALGKVIAVAGIVVIAVIARGLVGADRIKIVRVNRRGTRRICLCTLRRSPLLLLVFLGLGVDGRLSLPFLCGVRFLGLLWLSFLEIPPASSITALHVRAQGTK